MVLYSYPITSVPELETAFLELSLNEMTGTIPTSVQQLSSLQYFAMAFNELTGTLPTVLGRMSSLQFLNMRSSGVHGTIPTELGQLSSIGTYNEVLSLRNFALIQKSQYLDLRPFFVFVSETLILEGNWLSGIIPRELGNLYQASKFYTICWFLMLRMQSEHGLFLTLHLRSYFDLTHFLDLIFVRSNGIPKELSFWACRD